MNRTPTIIAGPCTVKLGTTAFATKDDVTVAITKETAEITASHVGKLGEKLLGLKAEIKFKPVEFDNLASLFPFLTWTYGAAVFGTTDTACEIYGADGTKWTFHRAAITGVGAIGVGVDQDVLGEFTVTAYPKPSLGLDGENALFTRAAATWTAPTLTASKILSVPFIGVYGDVAFDLEAGTTIIFEVKLSPRSCDRLGEFDQVFTGYDVKATVNPIGISEADWDTLVKPQAEARRGALLGASYSDLVLRGEKSGDPQFTLKCAVAKTGALNWGAGDKDRFGDIEFTATGTLGATKFVQGTAADDYAFSDD